MYIDTKLIQKICGADSPKFPLKNELPDKSFIFRSEQCPTDCTGSFFLSLTILIEVGLVLIMDTTQMSKRGNT